MFQSILRKEIMMPTPLLQRPKRRRQTSFVICVSTVAVLWISQADAFGPHFPCLVGHRDGSNKNFSQRWARSGRSANFNTSAGSSSSTNKSKSKKAKVSSTGRGGGGGSGGGRSSSKSSAPSTKSQFQEQPLQQPQQPTKKKSAPPWQVLSTKDTKRNLDLEKQRRAGIQTGILPTDATLDDVLMLRQQQQQDQPHNDGQGMRSLSSPPKTLSKAFLDPASAQFLNWRRFNPMKKTAGLRFVGSYLDDSPGLPRRGVPEIAFLGRSNVGKSSLLNRLSKSAVGGSGSADQARVGQTPGATASVNLYALQDAQQRDLVAWVDLPGFGYAKLSKETQERVQAAAERYLSRRRELALGILLVDVRRLPSDDDRAILAALYDRRVPLLVVATKLDKLTSVSAREKQLRIICEGLGLPENQPLAVSSVTGDGCRELWRIILEACEQCVAEFKSRYDESAAVELLSDKQEEEKGGQDFYTNDNDFDDNDVDDVAYNQGYDWIHGNPILYDTEDNSFDNSADDFYGDDYDDEEDLPYRDASPEEAPPVRETLKSLRKKARDMERRGEL